VKQEVFRAIADYTYDWESWIDRRGKTRWVNPAVERMTGYTVEECLKMRSYPLALIHPDDRERVRSELRSRPSANDVEMRVLHKDGSVRWVAMSWQPIGTLGYRTSVRDIHHRKKGEEALREAKQRAEEADRAKGEFLAVMSHEIRSPMQAISGYSQLLARTELSERQRQYVDVILRENAALLRIVDDVLDFSSLQTGALSIDRAPFDYREVVREVVDATRPKAEAKGVDVRARVSADFPPRVIGDRHRVRQVLLNLVDNAVKFTAKGGVRIDVRYGGEVTTRVSDTGIGIPRDKMKTLFRMFSQVDSSTSRRHGGSGLGLAICKRLVERMRGSIAATSARGKGSTFTFVLPLASAGAGSVEERGRPAPKTSTPLSVLVVDDSAVARDVACEFLSALGHRAEAVSSGRQAIARVKKKDYDLVFLDMQMPGLDGRATAEAIRRVTRAPALVALTANVFQDRAGFDAVLTKPLELEHLSETIARTSLRARVGREGAQVLKRLERARKKADKRFAAHQLKGLALIIGAHDLAAAADKSTDARVLRPLFEAAVGNMTQAV
jgi:PAS domain S-box-containing protein